MHNRDQLLDHLSIGVVVLDSFLEIKFWNKWMEEHSLLDRSEVLGKPIYDLFPSLIHKEFTKKARESFRNGTPAFFTNKANQYLFPFPSSRSLLSDNLSNMQQTVILSPLKDKMGETVRLLVSVFDITDWITNQHQLMESKEKLEKLSQIDELTGIQNRRSLMEKLKMELCIHARKKRPLALAMIDIDHFKKVNDTYGHQCGDTVLIKMANLFAGRLRGYDTLGRYGGEEFVIILPEATPEEAQRICERIRQNVEKKVFHYEKETIQMTISIGVASSEAHSFPEAEELLKKADDSLYQAKDNGRNQVVAFKEEG